MISKGKFLQNANFYLPFLQEYFSLFTFHSEGKLLYFILSSFITLPLHQYIFLSINEQITKIAQNHPAIVKTSSSEAPCWISR